MADIEKRLNKTAWKKGATWGTEIDVDGAGNGILPLNAGVPKLTIPPVEEESAASAFQSDIDQGMFDPVDFSLEFDARYEGLGPILAQVFGTAGTPTQQGATAAYLHVLQMADTIAGLYGTYCTEKKDKFHVVKSVKPYKLTFSLGDGLVKLAIEMKGDEVIDNSTIITSLASLTTPDIHNRILCRQAVWRMNDQTGAALAGGDQIRPRDFTLEIERPMEDQFECGRQAIIEPLENAKPMVKLTLNFNRYDDVNKLYFADWKAETEKKLDVVFTGALIESTYYYYFKFQFPRFKIEDVDYPDDMIIPATVVLRGLEADSAPTGMTGITKPVQLDIINRRTTDMLA